MVVFLGHYNPGIFELNHGTFTLKILKHILFTSKGLYFPPHVDQDQHCLLQPQGTIIILEEVRESTKILVKYMLLFFRMGSCGEHHSGLGRLGEIKYMYLAFGQTTFAVNDDK